MFKGPKQIRATSNIPSLSLSLSYISLDEVWSPCNLSLIIYESVLFHAFYIPPPVSKLLVRKWREQFYRVFVNAPSRVSYPKSNESNLYRLIRAGGILSAKIMQKFLYEEEKGIFFVLKEGI